MVRMAACCALAGGLLLLPVPWPGAPDPSSSATRTSTVRSGHVCRAGGCSPNDGSPQGDAGDHTWPVGQIGYGPASATDRAHFARALKASGGLVVSKSVSTLTVSGRDVGGVAVYSTRKSLAKSPVFPGPVRRAAHQRRH